MARWNNLWKLKHLIGSVSFMGGVMLIAPSGAAQIDLVDCAKVPEENVEWCERYNTSAEKLREDCAGENGEIAKGTCPVRAPMLRETYDTLVSKYREQGPQAVRPIASATQTSTPQPALTPAPQPARSAPANFTPAPTSPVGPADEMTIFGFELGKTFEEHGIYECTRKNREIIVNREMTPEQRRSLPLKERYWKQTSFCSYEVGSRVEEGRSCWMRTHTYSTHRGRTHSRCAYVDRRGNYIPEVPNLAGRYYRRPLYYIGPRFSAFIQQRSQYPELQGRRVGHFVLDEEYRLAGMFARTYANRANEGRSILIEKYGKPTRIERTAYLLENGSEITLDRYIWEKPHVYVEFSPINPVTFTEYKIVEVVSGNLRDRILGIPATSRIPIGTATDFEFGHLRILLPHIQEYLNTDKTVRQRL